MKMEPLSDARAIVELQVQMLGAGISPAPLDMPKPVTDPIDPVREDEDDVVVGEPDVDDEVVGGEGPQADGKEFFGQRGSDGFFYFAKADGDLKVADSDDNIVFSAQKASLPVEDVVGFLITAAKELKLDSIGMDILQHYDLLAPRREEEEPEKLEAPKVDEPKAEEPEKEPEAPPPDEPLTDGGSELPAAIESRVKEGKAEEKPMSKTINDLLEKGKSHKDYFSESRVVEGYLAEGWEDSDLGAAAWTAVAGALNANNSGDGDFVLDDRNHIKYVAPNGYEYHIWYLDRGGEGSDGKLIMIGPDEKEYEPLLPQKLKKLFSRAAYRGIGPTGLQQHLHGAAKDLAQLADGVRKAIEEFPTDPATAEREGEAARAADPALGGDFEEKDTARIQSIIAKSKGNADKAVQYAENMALSIQDADKLRRRAAAARALGREDIAKAFETEYMGGHPTEGKVPVVTSPEDKIINDLLEKHGLSEAVPGVSQAEAVPAGAPSPGQMTHKKDPKSPDTKEPQKGKVVADQGSAPNVVTAKDTKVEGVPAGAPSAGQPHPSKDKHFPTNDVGPDGKPLPQAPKVPGVKMEGRVPEDPTALDSEDDYIKALLEKLN